MRSRKPLLLLLIAAMLLLRGLAVLSLDPCAMEQTVAAHAAGGQDSHGPGNAHAHCSGAVFLPAAEAASLPARTTGPGATHGAPVSITFVPRQPDRPPLAVLR